MTASSRTAPPDHEPTSSFQMDRALQTLRSRAESWPNVPIGEKLEYLRSILRRTLEVAPAMVADTVAAKGVTEQIGAEDWVSGPVCILRTVRFLTDTLETIRRTGRVATGPVSTRPDGQVTVRVTPADRYDRVLYAGWTADVWLDPEIDRADLDDHVGGIYTKPETVEPGVAAVLGAGNVASIGALDVVHKLFAEGRVTLLKHSPVNDYIGPHLERAFADLIHDGYLRTAYGGSEVGAALVGHPEVDVVHITGASTSHDAIVFGSGDEGAARKARNEPLLEKPITSELGNVSPVIIVPGSWKPADLQYQAEHLATQMMQNNGFNCNAAKVLVLPRGWAQRDEFLDRLRRVLLSLPPRPAHYPGAEERFDRFANSFPHVELLGARADGFIPPALLVGLDAGRDHLAFEEESFCSITAITELDAGDPGDYLDRAVEFCNERLEGSLNATIVVDPGAATDLGPRLDAAAGALRYGAIGINVWGGAVFALGTTPWGAFPGHTLDDIQSGRGFVHNARLLDRPQKTVLRAPFRIVPKPPWFVTHRNAHRVFPAVAALEADPSPLKLPRILAAALRG